MRYQIVIGKKTTKAIQKLPKITQKHIYAAIVEIGENPYAGKKLEGEYEGAWVIRAWPYRIIYTINDDTVTVTIVKIGHRQGVYK